jgi:hypothetical protein
MLKLIRMTASTAACPFCIDMTTRTSSDGITDEEAESLRGDFEQVSTFSEREKLAIAYTRVISQTPMQFHPDLVERVKSAFTAREFVILASTAAQVNYWARLIQALGIPPAGFGNENKKTSEIKTQRSYFSLFYFSHLTSPTSSSKTSVSAGTIWNRSPTTP